MSDYIKREDIIKTIESETYRHDYLDHVIDIIEAIPSADVAPVRHGRWEADMGGVWCSVCGEYSEGEWDYCPYCGARMDGEYKWQSKNR